MCEQKATKVLTPQPRRKKEQEEKKKHLVLKCEQSLVRVLATVQNDCQLTIEGYLYM